jgi:hypothetical protein
LFFSGGARRSDTDHRNKRGVDVGAKVPSTLDPAKKYLWSHS